MRSEALKKAQKKYKANIKRKYVEFDMRDDVERKKYDLCNHINFSQWVKDQISVYSKGVNR